MNNQAIKANASSQSQCKQYLNLTDLFDDWTILYQIYIKFIIVKFIIIVFRLSNARLQ